MKTKMIIIMAVAIMTVTATDMIHTMGKSYVSSAVPAFIFSLYLWMQDNKEEQNRNDEEEGKVRCSKCMKMIKRCICACGNWE